MVRMPSTGWNHCTIAVRGTAPAGASLARSSSTGAIGALDGGGTTRSVRDGVPAICARLSMYVRISARSAFRSCRHAGADGHSRSHSTELAVLPSARRLSSQDSSSGCHLLVRGRIASLSTRSEIAASVRLPSPRPDATSQPCLRSTSRVMAKYSWMLFNASRMTPVSAVSAAVVVRLASSMNNSNAASRSASVGFTRPRI